MADWIEDVAAGQPISADWGNQIRDLAVRRDSGDNFIGGPTGGHHTSQVVDDPLWFPFTCDVEVPPCAMMVTDEAVLQVLNRIVKTRKHDGTSYGVSLVAWDQTTPAGGIGLCSLASVRPTDVAMASGVTTGTRVGPVTDSWNAGDADGNAEFACLIDESGGKSAVLRLGGSSGGAWISFTPTAAFSSADDAFEATVNAVHGNVPFAVDDTVTVTNELGFSGDDTTPGYATWDADTECLYMYAPPCPQTS